MKLVSLHILMTSLLSTACMNVTIGGNADDLGTPDGSVQPDAPDVLLPDAAPSADAPPPVPCEEGAAQVTDETTGVCYMYFSDAVTWQQAVDACEAIGNGTHLATSTTPAENDLLLALGPVDAADIWMGANDLAVEGEWIWITGESMQDYDNWRLNEPNDGGDNGSEECMVFEIDRPTGTWDDRPCANVYTYFCERAPAVP